MLNQQKTENLPAASFKDSYYFKVMMDGQMHMTVMDWEEKVRRHRITTESVDAWLRSLEGNPC